LSPGIEAGAPLDDPAALCYLDSKGSVGSRAVGREGRVESGDEGSGLTEALVEQLGYIGIALILVLGGLGLPVPEEAPIILAAILSRAGKMWWPYALASCMTGVLLGDFVVYLLGYVYGQKVLSLPLTRKLLTRARETQIQGYFHRHGFKILILGRFAVGFRTAAYLTAGILKLPALRLFLTDLFAASLSTFLMFGLGYVFAHQIQTNLDRAKYWLTTAVAVSLVTWLLYRYYKARQRAGLPVGPRVLESLDVPLPPDDLHAHPDEFPPSSPTVAPPPPPATPPAAKVSPTPRSSNHLPVGAEESVGVEVNPHAPLAPEPRR
jgi:membrane protein DedA with SNARE-associated domain